VKVLDGATHSLQSREEVAVYADQARFAALSELRKAKLPWCLVIYDLRPLRSLVFGQRHKALDADLVRTIHGIDALLVLTGSRASANLQSSRFIRS
jgi:hypothetical protein